MIITIPFRTPTINHLYFNWQNRRILTKEARELKKKIKEIVDKYSNETGFLHLFENDYLGTLRVSVEIYENWYCKKGGVKKKDLDNRSKFLVDSIFDALNIDDKFIFEHKMIKKQSLNEEKSIVEIERI